MSPWTSVHGYPIQTWARTSAIYKFFCGLPQTPPPPRLPQENTRILGLPRLSSDCFLPDPFQYIIRNHPAKDAVSMGGRALD
jgi:hypothetical protein